MAFIYDLTDTWNAGGTTFNAIKLNVTDIASAATSKLITLQVGGIERFGVDKAGVITFGSAVRLVNGTTGAPAFSFTGDTNTGMWSPAADTLAFSEGGVEVMRIDSSGNVGIGTSSPSERLDTGSGNTRTQSLIISGNQHLLYSADANTLGIRIGTAGPFYGIGTTGSFNMRLNSASGGDMLFAIAGTERARINSSGNVGIGTSSPGQRLTVAGGYADLGGLRIAGSAVDALNNIFLATGELSLTTGSGAIVFKPGTIERVRIDSSGNLLVGTSASEGPARLSSVSTVSTTACISYRNTAGSGSTFAYFLNGANTAQIGTITNNGNTGTLYNTSSDYRLKDIDGPIANSGAYIDALKPVQGSWKADGSRFIGLLAHEAQEVSETQIATGEKDGEQMQAMDYSAPEIIANLIAELQSVRARLAQLEGN